MQHVFPPRPSAACLTSRRQSTIARCTTGLFTTQITSTFALVCLPISPTAGHDAGIFSVSTARCAQPPPRWWLPDLSSKRQHRSPHIPIWASVAYESAQSAGFANTTIAKPEPVPGPTINGLSSVWRCQHVPESGYLNLSGCRNGYCRSIRYARMKSEVKPSLTYSQVKPCHRCPLACHKAHK